MPSAVRTFAFPLALATLIVMSVALVGLVSGLEQWGRWLLRTGGSLGIVGLVVTGIAVANLLVPRTCSTEPVPEVNRPVLSVALGDGACFRSALAQLQLAVLVGLGASVAVATRSGRDAAGAAHAVPSR